MDDERLQEIKSCIEEWIEELNTWEGPGDLYHHFLVKHGFRAEAVLEPFAALEAAQQQLEGLEHEKQCTEHLMTSPNDRWDELGEWLDQRGYINQSFLLRCDEERTDLRAKLAETQAEVAELLDTKREFIKAKPLRKQLVIANDHNELLERIIDSYRKGYKEFKEDFAETRIRLEAEVERLENLYNSDRVKYLEDITLLQAEIRRKKDTINWYSKMHNK